MHPTPYEDLNGVLDELVSRMQSILQGDLTGAYLQGSFALGDFDRHSDVDFIAVVEQELSQPQVEALQAMHAAVYALECPWAQHLEGSYFPKETLRAAPVKGSELWYLDHGASTLIRADHCNTLLVRWVVLEKGVTLAGPPPETLIDSIPVGALRAEMYATLTTWGREILNDPEVYNNHFYQSFIVLNYCRMLHDLRRGHPGSKRAGAGWAQANLDPRWSDLIERAWDGRPDPARKVKTPADPQDFALTLKLVETVMAESRLFMDSLRI